MSSGPPARVRPQSELRQGSALRFFDQPMAIDMDHVGGHAHVRVRHDLVGCLIQLDALEIDMPGVALDIIFEASGRRVCHELVLRLEYCALLPCFLDLRLAGVGFASQATGCGFSG